MKTSLERLEDEIKMMSRTIATEQASNAYLRGHNQALERESIFLRELVNTLISTIKEKRNE